MESIIQEVHESQKVRSDLYKWKIILVSAIGATALGFNKEFQKSEAHFLLCFIPFVCLYIDILCYHISIRIKVIGIYLSADENTLKKYHEYALLVSKKGGFSFDKIAQIGSTILLSCLIVPIGILIEYKQRSETYDFAILGSYILFLLAALIGIIGVVWLRILFNRKTIIIKEAAKDIL